VETLCDIAIVGAGAAGLAAAIFAAEGFHRTASDRRATRIVVFESARSVGAKILISGGGRCNVSLQARLSEVGIKAV
jgi:predicted flavoprotein YhiN